MVGLLIGLAGGVLQYILLRKLAKRLSAGMPGGGLGWIIALQFLIPAPVLGLCAAVRTDDLLYAGIGITAVIIGGSLTEFIIALRRSKKKDGD